ncbi:unnamed protein product [Pelagomonas calceolata]|uniref:Uncharacterized protein n=1 Tax=Pelagomonas calceolata TaxID=35677 RepID=A0A7S4EDV4_9STRA|nr:unnamed protein product [Pelagomonas calceolata]CAH0375564.1 unnamed protein product [Pelagomonas calceolata]
MEWLLCNCGLPAGLEPGATDSAPEEFDEGLEEERQDRRDRRSRRGDGTDRAERRERRRRREGDRRDGVKRDGSRRGGDLRDGDKRDKPRRRPSKELEKSVSFEDESPVGVEALNLQDRHAAKMTASSPRARERWITGSWTATETIKGPSPLLVETPQAQPSMKPSVSDAMRKKKSALMRGNQNFGPIAPPPRYGEPPMWQATAVAAPLTIDGARNFRELLRTMRVDDLLRMDSYRNSALAYFASRDCVKGCNLVLRFADEKTRVLLAARPNLYGLTALDYARHHHRRGSSIMAVFRHYGVERCVYKREEN